MENNKNIQEVKVNDNVSNDDASLAAQYSKGPFILGLTRFLISLKNHINKFGLFFTVVSMLVGTCIIFIKVRAIYGFASKNGTYDSFSAIFYFVSTLFAILSCVAYMNAYARHSSNVKKYSMLGVYFVMMIAQVVFEFLFVFSAYRALADRGDQIDNTLGYNVTSMSLTWTYIHISLLIASIIIAILVIFLQPVCKKINVDLSFLSFKKKNK